jgi:putative RNA 2'-phosphotransferase
VEQARAVRISKLLSYALRHDPAALGIQLDDAGWTDVDAVLNGLATRGEAVSRADLEEVVAASDKQRFAIEGSRLRANQGHSVDIDLGLERRQPPEVLYHGTVSRFVESIRAEGLSRGKRTHVHLSADARTAETVGKRRGTAVVLKVLARAMHEAGHAFFLSENEVWLTEHVPARFLEIPPPSSQR